jgi:RNA polymerase sigma-70 factor, ECF subfamily
METETGTLKSKAEFEILVKKNMKRAYFSALAIIGSHDAAMDLSQEAFVKAYKHFNKFDRSMNFFTWYYKILRNLCLNFIRDSKRKREISFIKAENIFEESFESYEREELKRNLEESLMELNEENREIISLKEFELMSYKEISEALEIPIGTVMSKLFYARKKLAGKLKEKYND